MNGEIRDIRPQWRMAAKARVTKEFRRPERRKMIQILFKDAAHSHRISPKTQTGFSAAPVTQGTSGHTSRRGVSGFCVMFFLLRVAFWLSIVLVLLPSGKYQVETTSPTIGAADAVSAATAAVSDMSGFCSRQPEACQVGGQAAVAFGQRAQAGARYLFDLLHDSLSPAQTGSIPRTGKQPQSQHTLTPADMAPDWRGPLPPKDPRRPA